MRQGFIVLAIFAFGASIAGAQPERMTSGRMMTAAPCTSGTITSLFFLKIPEIRGDSRDTSFFTGGVSDSQLREFVIVKPLDASSQKLGQARQTGERLPEIIITLRPAGDSFLYKLADVLLVSDVQGSGPGQSETVHLKPSRIMMDYNSSSRPETSVKAGYDLKQAKKM